MSYNIKDYDALLARCFNAEAELERVTTELAETRDAVEVAVNAVGKANTELERVTTERDHLDHMQAAFQTGIGLARLELSGVTPDPALAMQRLNRAVEESDRLRATYRATSEQETSGTTTFHCYVCDAPDGECDREKHRARDEQEADDA